MDEVAVEACLVDGRQWAETHGDRRELPPVGHQAWVRVAGQTPATDLETVVVELLVTEPAFHVRAGIDTGGRVALEEHLVACCAVGLAAEEMVEADLVEGCGACKGRKVAADTGIARVRPRDHDGGVPTYVAADPALEILVTGEPRLGPRRDRVDVRARDGRGEANLVGACPLQQLHQEELGTRTATGLHDGIEGVHPLRGLLGIDVGQLI